jgi:hypothetical protein
MSRITNSVSKLLYYGWSDKNIANYLMIKERMVHYYRKKFGIGMNSFQRFY